MAEQTRKATIEVQTKGHDETARKELEVAEAQETMAKAAEHKADALRDANRAAAEGVEGHESAGKSTSEHADAVGKLREEIQKASPAVGEFIETIFNLAATASLLSSKNISLVGTFKQIVEWAKKAGGAMKLLGAGGAAFTAILHLWNTWSRINDEIKAYVDGVDEAAKKTAQMNEELRAGIVEALSDAGNASPETIGQATRRAGRLIDAGFDESLSKRVAASTAGQDATSDQLLRAAAAARSGQADASDPNLLAKTRSLSGESARIVDRQLQVTLQENVRELQRFMEQLTSFDVTDGGVTGRITGKKSIEDTGPFDADLAQRVLGAGSAGRAKELFGILQGVHVRQRVEGRGGDAYGIDLPHPDEPATREMVGVLKIMEQTLANTMKSVEELARKGGTTIQRQINYGSPNGPRGGANGQNYRERSGRG